jgi:arabinogalactan oligomer / maltooligosaccharide transport system substrate-binding protein
MRIRTAGVVALAAALTLAASGCGGGDDEPATQESPKATGGKLVIWADDKRTAALKPFAEKFGQENGVTVEVQAVSKDLQTNFVTASQQGSGPDVVVGAHDWIGNLVQNGAIDPVQLAAEQKSAFNETAVKAVTFNGQIYGVPYAMENLALFRNTELAPAAPKTIEELVATGKKLKAEKKVTEILCLQVGQKGDAYHIYPLYTSAGG